MRIGGISLLMWGLGAAASTAATVPATLGQRDFILPASSAAPEERGRFTPTKAQAYEAKRSLLAYLRTPHPGIARQGDALAWSEAWRPVIAAAIDSYYLQYLGVSIRWTKGSGKRDAEGDREIEIKGLCDHGLIGPEERVMLGKQEVLIMDGGKCVFTADYSLARHQIVWFAVNGVA
jgi:hypothetical protein